MSKEKIKSNVVEAPTMFIGVGGTGCKIVKKVYKHCTSEERENIGFVCLDTNVNDLSEIKGDSKDIYCVQTSNTQTVGSYLDNDKDASKYWFPKNAVIYDKTVSEGAGQLRAISRLAFNSTIKTGKIAPLYEAIDNLFKKNGQAMKQALRVCVVSTASGGTGSGMILPFCMFLRDYVNNKYPNASVILRTMILLPETLDTVIKSSVEKDSQRRNAYATIKELNAFMMKGSGFCDIEESLKRYKDLHVDVTDPGRKSLKTLTVLPCDFCFLLDGQDAEDATSNSFEQYQNQAALALYEQNVGPMQKKAFSVEDNIIKELSNPGNYGRNRFGGIGAGRIIYPYSDIVDYIAYDWTKGSVGGDGEKSKWLKYDQAVALQKIEDDRMDKPEDERLSAEESYINEFEKMEKGDTFTHDLKMRYRLGDSEERIERFEDAIFSAISEIVESNQKISDAKASVKKLSNKGFYMDADHWVTAASDYQAAVKYRDEVTNVTKRVASNNAEGILRTEKNAINIKDDKNIESILRNASGEFCHPIAARYMLYALYTDVCKKLVETNDEKNEALAKLDKAVKEKTEPYNLKYLGKKESPITSLLGLANSVSQLQKGVRKTRKYGEEAGELLSKELSSFIKNVEKLEEAIIKQEIYLVLKEYLSDLNTEYKKFFSTFGKKCGALEIKQGDLVDILKYKKGDSIRNVCSSKEMLEELSRSTSQKRENSKMLNNDLNAKIYDSVKANAKFERELKMNADAVEDDGRIDIFDEVLVGYFKEQVVKDCPDIDMNIIQAIVKEYKLLEKIKAKEDQKEKDETVVVKKDEKAELAYVKSIIAQGEMISAAGIQKMVGEEAREVNVCAYKKELKEMRDYRMDDLLPNGAAVDSVSKYELHYFNALYNLTPDKLKKFSSPKKSETGTRPGGLYHSAYTTYTRDIGPDCLKSSKMTTHIDRRWDSIAEMPELDLEYQHYQFLRTHRALVYGLVFERIKKMDYLDDNAQLENAAKAFRYRNTGNHIEDMVVSNGSLCDEFYEILDSLYIDRALVENIYEYESKETAKDIMKRSRYEETKFYKYILGFEMPKEEPLGESYEERKAREAADLARRLKKKEAIEKGEKIEDRSSLFEIPLAYYNSLPSYKHDEAELNSLVDAVIDVFRNQIGKYESEKNAKFVLCGVLKDQYDLLLENYKKNADISKNVGSSENKVLEIIERKVEDVFESSPQPQNYENDIDEMKGSLLKE